MNSAKSLTRMIRKLFCGKNFRVNDKLRAETNVRLELPSVVGLEVPEGLVCDREPHIYIDCWWQDWAETSNTSRYYCDIWGPYRGQCVHINDSGMVLDYSSLNLTNSRNGASAFCDTPKKGQDGVWCYNYEQSLRRECNVYALDKCDSKWMPYGDNKWGDCSYRDSDKICVNDTKSSWRNCHMYNANFWECKTYKMTKGRETNVFLYKAFLKDPNMTYYVSQVNNLKTDASAVGGVGDGGQGVEVDAKDL